MSSPPSSAGVGPAYLALIASARVSANTRRALHDRMAPDDPAHHPTTLTPAALATLRAVAARVLPQDGPAPIDFAARIDTALAGEGGDGWRYADMPPDRASYAAGLATLDAAAQAAHAQPYAGLDAGAQDALLQQAADGALTAAPFSPAEMRHWFEEVRADVVKLYVSHPSTMERMGYSGIAYGGDGPGKPGFHDLEPGAREPWEPGAKP